MKKIFGFIFLVSLFASCTKGTNERYLILKFRFTDTLQPLNDTGKIYTDADRQSLGWTGLTPIVNKISAHKVLFYNNDPSLNEAPYPVYIGKESFTKRFGDSLGIDYDKASMVKEGENLIEIPLSTLRPGTYNWMLVELSYQNLTVPIRLDSVWQPVYINNQIAIPSAGLFGVYSATVAGFSGFNHFFNTGFYINKYFYRSNKDSFYLNDGWYFTESTLGANGFNYPLDSTYLSDRGEIVKVNPLHKNPLANSKNLSAALFQTLKFTKQGNPIMTTTPLVITGNETESIVIECALATKNCFEWRDNRTNGMWDAYRREPVRFGFRGMQPVVYK